MFDTILIANRGEIACRIARSARAMGLRSVAVYSDADAGAAHVAACDVAVHIGAAPPAQSYLKTEAILAAAKATGAQAIHPGYGFLSENPAFVDAVEAAGLTFIGPSARAIRAMGLKDAAKALMEQAGVPVVPGYHGADQSDALLAAEAEKIGFPVLIKAVAGGGGKGMRRVENGTDLADALRAARAEAKGAFGNSDVLIEKYVERPRHIEMQVFGDGTRAVHLYERDCSLQRRHQKVIEEAPAPGMTAEMRAAMGAAAVRAAEAIGYRGAGTVEFIVDGSGGLRPDGFWFMEMNTRLQVEHPVTEAITGIDLVEWQIRVAAGDVLPLSQEQIPLAGHAFEARLYAEDVPKGFLPATGTLTHLAFPAGCRADTGVRCGDTISPHYDPMIAKVVTHGATRALALRRLAAALRDTQVAGTVTNLAFLGALAAHDGFAAGEVDTGLIARDIDALTAAPPVTATHVAQAALAALGLLTPPQWDTGFTLWLPPWRSVELWYDGDAANVMVQVRAPDCIHVDVGDERVVARWRDGWVIGDVPAVAWARSGTEITLFKDHGIVFEATDTLDRAQGVFGEGNLIEAPMPGLVRRMLARVGQAVSVGDKLAVLEAMKMEHVLTAARDGVVAELLVAEGTQVEAGAALVRLEDESEDAA